jgi:hypothetical protein
MTNTVFPTFQTQYILDFSSASRNRNIGICRTLRFSSIEMLLLDTGKKIAIFYTINSFPITKLSFSMRSIYCSGQSASELYR